MLRLCYIKAYFVIFLYNIVASKHPIIWETINPNMFNGWMPVKVSVKDLAMVMAGFAKEVEEVKK